jgi:hypothetical protein
MQKGEKMKIAMFSWETLHSITVGGIAPVVTELAAALERKGNEVHVFTRMGEGSVYMNSLMEFATTAALTVSTPISLKR